MGVSVCSMSSTQTLTELARFISTEPERTLALGVALANCLDIGDCVLLMGHIGAGKTCLTRGIAMGAGVPDPSIVHSPSFTLVNRYSGRVPIIHADLYRLDSDSALNDFEFEELWTEPAILIIEWPEIALARIPHVSVQIKLVWPMSSPNERHIVIHTADSKRFSSLNKFANDH